MKQSVTTQPDHSQPEKSSLAALSLAALGVVFGDIGTSPLYALKECFHSSHGLVPSAENILGILSLIFWALILVISLKYLSFILRADNQGEGGIMALTALILPQHERNQGNRKLLVILGLFGAALLYGDGMITPAISVLSAIEGLNVATPAVSHMVIPLTVVVLVLLFLVQSHGTGKVGAVFGPLTLVWFLVLAATRDCTDLQASDDSYSDQPALRAAVPAPQRLVCFPGAGLGFSGRDRRRSALCRYGPLWRSTDPPGLVQPCPAGTGDQLASTLLEET